MGVELDTEKLDMLLQRLHELEAQIAAALAEQVAAEIAVNWSVESPSGAGETPAVVTGELAGSVHIEGKSASEQRVGSSVGYGRLLEYGTSKMAARPWLRPAVERVRQQIQVIVKQAFQLEGKQDAERERGDTFAVD